MSNIVICCLSGIHFSRWQGERQHQCAWSMGRGVCQRRSWKQPTGNPLHDGLLLLRDIVEFMFSTIGQSRCDCLQLLEGAGLVSWSIRVSLIMTINELLVMISNIAPNVFKENRCYNSTGCHTHEDRKASSDALLTPVLPSH